MGSWPEKSMLLSWLRRSNWPDSLWCHITCVQFPCTEFSVQIWCLLYHPFSSQQLVIFSLRILNWEGFCVLFCFCFCFCFCFFWGGGCLFVCWGICLFVCLSVCLFCFDFSGMLFELWEVLVSYVNFVLCYQLTIQVLYHRHSTRIYFALTYV